jgi:hypothetical protein
METVHYNHSLNRIPVFVLHLMTVEHYSHLYTHFPQELFNFIIPSMTRVAKWRLCLTLCLGYL